MLLFGEMSEATVMAIIALVGTSLTGLYQILSKSRQYEFERNTASDKLKYDVKLAVLEAAQKRCEQEDATKNIRIATLESHIVTLTATDVRDKLELESKIEKVTSNHTAALGDSKH